MPTGNPFLDRAGRAMNSVYWSKENMRFLALTPQQRDAEDIEKHIAASQADRDAKQKFFEAVSKVDSFDKLSPEVQSVFLTAEAWQDGDDDDRSQQEAKMADIPSVTPCVMVDEYEAE